MANFPCKYGYGNIIRFKLTKKSQDVVEGQVVGVFMSVTLSPDTPGEKEEPIYICHSLEDAPKQFFFKEVKESNVIND